jgi:peptidyl-prolyl cis-trans isomerase D
LVTHFISYKQIISPIEGTTGIYVVKNVSTTKAPANKDFTICSIKGQTAGDVNRVLPALKG